MADATTESKRILGRALCIQRTQLQTTVMDTSYTLCPHKLRLVDEVVQYPCCEVEVQPRLFQRVPQEYCLDGFKSTRDKMASSTPVPGLQANLSLPGGEDGPGPGFPGSSSAGMSVPLACSC